MRAGLRSALVLLALMVTGCVASPPVVMQSDFQRKVITMCDNDVLCLQNDYSVTWDRWHCKPGDLDYGYNKNYYSYVLPAYPVTYRNKNYILHTGSYGYTITLPEGGTVKSFPDDSSPN